MSGGFLVKAESRQWGMDESFVHSDYQLCVCVMY